MQTDSKYIGLLWSTPSPQLVVTTPSKSDSCNNWAASSDEELVHTSGQSCSRSVPPTLARCNGSGPVSRAGESSLWNTRRPSHCLSSTRSSSKHTYIHTNIYTVQGPQWTMRIFSILPPVFVSILIQIFSSSSFGSPGPRSP